MRTCILCTKTHTHVYIYKWYMKKVWSRLMKLEMKFVSFWRSSSVSRIMDKHLNWNKQRKLIQCVVSMIEERTSATDVHILPKEIKNMWWLRQLPRRMEEKSGNSVIFVRCSMPRLSQDLSVHVELYIYIEVIFVVWWADSCHTACTAKISAGDDDGTTRSRLTAIRSVPSLFSMP